MKRVTCSEEVSGRIVQETRCRQSERNTALGESGEIELQTVIDMHRKCDPSTRLFGDNKEAAFYKLQQDNKKKSEATYSYLEQTLNERASELGFVV